MFNPLFVCVCMCTAGKYSLDRLPPGPRGNLFRQLLPGIQPVLTTLEAVADSRRKTMSQVSR